MAARALYVWDLVPFGEPAVAMWAIGGTNYIQLVRSAVVIALCDADSILVFIVCSCKAILISSCWNAKNVSNLSHIRYSLSRASLVIRLRMISDVRLESELRIIVLLRQPCSSF